MAAKYSLQPDEVVVLKEQNIMHGGFLSVYTDELILTNRNLVLLKKGVFGNSKDILTFPVSQIKVHDGKAQAVIGKAGNGTPRLDVYFLNGEESFAFQNGGKKKLLHWISKIREVVAGNFSPEDGTSAGLAIPGAEFVAGALKDTINVFKRKMGSEPAPVSVSGKCVGCAAAVSGIQGQSIECDYCGTQQQI